MERIKILFTGSIGSGKTTAISAISEVEPITTEAKPTDEVGLRKQTTTVAMDFGYVTLEDGTRLYLYGSPGQRRFDFMSQILIHKAIGLIVLVNNNIDDPLADLDYYLNLHGEFLSKNWAVIGVTHYDEQDSPSVDDYLRALAERGEPWPVLKIDARKRQDVIMLVETLLATLEYG